MPKGVYERKPFTEEHKSKMGLANKARVGEANPNWAGDEVSYNALHMWVARNKERTGVCEHCHLPARTDFANVSGGYLRDIDDFIELCRPCHFKFDNQKETNCES